MQNIENKLTKALMGVSIVGIALSSSCCTTNTSKIELLENQHAENYTNLTHDFANIFYIVGGVDLLLELKPDQIPDTIADYNEIDNILGFKQFMVERSKYAVFNSDIKRVNVIFYDDNKRVAKAEADSVSFYYDRNNPPDSVFKRKIEIRLLSSQSDTFYISISSTPDPVRIGGDNDKPIYQPDAKVDIECYQIPPDTLLEASAEVIYSLEMQKDSNDTVIAKDDLLTIDFQKIDNYWQMVSSNKKLSDLLEED